MTDWLSSQWGSFQASQVGFSADHALQIAVVSSEAVCGELHEELLSLCLHPYKEDFSSHLKLLSPAMHVLARPDGELISHAAWVERELRAEHPGSFKTAYVKAVATLPAYQGRSYARVVLSKIPILVSDFALAALSTPEEDYYRRLGWE